jgi:hypothetical protein
MNKKMTHERKILAGDRILRDFWVGSGPIGSGEDALRLLRELSFSKSEIRELGDMLPMVGGTGTTGQRIATAGRVLERLGR